MLIRILYFIFLLAFIRFIVRLVRELAKPKRPPHPLPRGSREDPTRGHRVIDVDYEELKPGERPEKGSR